MEIIDVNPICIKFNGLDAEHCALELSALAHSLQGISKLIGSSGQACLEEKYIKSKKSNKKYEGIKVMALPAQAGSYEFWVMIVAGGMSITPLLPGIDFIIKTAATKAIEAMVNSTIAHWAGRNNEKNNADIIAVKALEEMGHTSRQAMKTIEKVVLSNQSAAKALVYPLGISADTIQIGQSESGAFYINEKDKEIIENNDSIELSDETIISIKITELDLITKNCKVSTIFAEKNRRRISGHITDPQILFPNNPYSSAFNNHTEIYVKAKIQYINGAIDKIFISDVSK